MYIEIVDETGQVSQEILQHEPRYFRCCPKNRKRRQEMAVTFVTNERSHELNLWYRDTDRPTDVISLEYKPELDITFSRKICLKTLN